MRAIGALRLLGLVPQRCRQCTESEIASFFGISLRTFERRKSQPAVAEAMERGKARGRLSLRRSLWALAQKGNPAANIFLAKNLLGYKDYFSNEHSGPGGGPIVIGPAPELEELTHDELKQLSLRVGQVPLVMIDGREIKWDELGRMLMSYEGWQFKLQIRDKSEEC